MTPFEEARSILARLVAFPTVSRDSNLALIDWVEDYLAGHGITAHRVWNVERTKANLYAQVGPSVPGGIVLSGHSDVVPVDGQAWATDPWLLTERDGRLFGRGTCDMKGFVALMLAAVPMALAAGVKRPLQIAISYDEERGCTGCVGMVEEMAAVLPRAAAVIVGEPTRMKVVTGHKGGAGYHVHVKGFEVHSSIMHLGVSAILEAGRLIGWVNDRNETARSAMPGPIAATFDPPWTTWHVGQIAGGTAHNITAADCRLGVDVRVVPGEAIADHLAAFEAEVAQVAAAMALVRPEAGISLDRYFEVPPLVPEADGAAERLARGLTGDNGLHVVSYGTEAGHFQNAGYSAVVCGPGDIAQAHQPDEYIEVSEFRAGLAFMERLVAGLAA
ncbi:acetylornithine deacetylase [Frigidibacter sp. RF13]|uniref:acetylornithine deacetylase n=1 Tax=Frigidibacter sp. RF13 TaxID=2997340 RepID=UPI002271B632|nr:acetylornithine deacetylase [Frigidibacter sp. RF13]MCY1125959.1 acetylornithine deacetylase [Frigidibacter sp. RF13]